MRKMIIVFLLGIICLTGCAKETMSGNLKRFIKVGSYPDFYVVYDSDTGVMYAVSAAMYNRGTFTLLVDADGKPLLYDRGDTE